jgi:hypothetical protein
MEKMILLSAIVDCGFWIADFGLEGQAEIAKPELGAKMG